MQIQLTNINKSFGDHQIFTNFSLTIPTGEFVVITGKSGRGKTSLLNMIGLLEKYDSGTLTLGDYKNPKINSKTGAFLLEKHLAFLFQNYGLIDNKNVYENLKIALQLKKISKAEIQTQIAEALKLVDLAGFEKRSIYSLSGGEQQRVSIARLILQNSDIILADEPTSALDTENEQAIIDLLRKLNEMGKTIILVTHNPSLKQFASMTVDL